MIDSLNRTNVSKLVTILSWLSLFTWTWLFIFRLLPHESTSWTGFLFFAIVGFVAETYEEAKHKR